MAHLVARVPYERPITRLAGTSSQRTWVDVEAEVINGPKATVGRKVWVRVPLEELTRHLGRHVHRGRGLMATENGRALPTGRPPTPGPHPTPDDVFRVVRAHEPVTVEDVRTHLNVDWASRQTIRNRLYELENAGRIISDDGRPMRFIVNMLLEHEWRQLPLRDSGRDFVRVMACSYCPARYRPEMDDEPPGPCEGERD